MASVKSLSMPPELELRNIVYSKNFGETNLGIVIRNGFTNPENRSFATETGAVFYIDKEDKYVISSGPLATINKHIGSPLKIIGKHIPVDVNEFKTMSSSRGLTDEQRSKQFNYFRDILEKEAADPIIQDNLALSKAGIDISSYTDAEGRHRRRRKSRRHKKTNRRRRKSNRRKSRRYKK